MSEVLFKLQGHKAELFVYENRVIIIYKKQGQESLYQYINFNEIEEVVVVPVAKALGKIEFVLNKDEIDKCRYCVEVKEAKAKQINLFLLEIKAYVDEKLAFLNEKPSSASIEKVRGIYNLFKEGIITQDEFELKKNNF